MSKWESISGFHDYHYEVIEKLALVSCDNSEDVTRLAYELWTNVRILANRTPMTLCFDCVYIVANATGNKLSLPLLGYAGEQVIQRNVKAMQNKTSKDERWFLSPKGKSAIINLFDGNEDLYNDILRPWIDVYGDK